MFQFFWWVSVSGVPTLSSKTTSWSKIVLTVDWRQVRQGLAQLNTGRARLNFSRMATGQTHTRTGRVRKVGPCRPPIQITCPELLWSRRARSRVFKSNDQSITSSPCHTSGMPVIINLANFSSNLIYVTNYRVQFIPMSVFVITIQCY